MNEHFGNEMMGKNGDVSVGMIYVTKNYSQFKKLQGNRDTSEARIAKISASVAIKQLPIPIIVNEKMEVIDGQGRLEVFRRNDLPVWYCICPGLTIADCLNANIHSTNWSERDIIKMHARTGNSDYARLINVMEQFSVEATTVMLAAGTSVFCTEKRKSMKNGEMVFTEKDMQIAKERLWKYEDVESAISDMRKVRQKNILRNSIIRCCKEKGYDHERMVTSCRKNAVRYRDCPTVADMLSQLAAFYNRGKRTAFMDVYGTGAGLKVRFDAAENRF